MKRISNTLSTKQSVDLLKVMNVRFESSMNRHKDIEWQDVEAKLQKNTQALWSLQNMEATGGEPDVLKFEPKSGEYIFYDCSAESPSGRRSLCYDRKALDDRKENKPKNSALDMASEMGIEILTEEQYRYMQTCGTFDTKTSSWIATPSSIRTLGGAIFADFRYETVFIYHNGAESYYASRGFRGMIRV